MALQLTVPCKDCTVSGPKIGELHVASSVFFAFSTIDMCKITAICREKRIYLEKIVAISLLYYYEGLTNYH